MAFQVAGLAGVVTESILVYAYILIYCIKNQGLFLDAMTCLRLRLRHGRQDIFFSNNTGVNNVLGFGWGLRAGEPVLGEDGEIRKVNRKVVIEVGFITPAVIQTVPIEPAFREPIHIEQIHKTVVI